MEYNGKVILQRPTDLASERLYLVIQAGLVPVKVNSGLSYPDEPARAILLHIIVKEGFKSGQLAMEIIRKVFGVKSYHGTAQIRPCIAYTDQVRKSLGIDGRKKQISQTCLPCPLYDLRQVVAERLVIDMTVSVNQFSHLYGSSI